MYQTGDMVVYGGEGVCRVQAVGTPDISGVDRQKDYYTLTPLYRDGVIFTPVDTPVFMRPAMTRDQAMDMILGLPAIPAAQGEGIGLRALTEEYQSLIHSHELEDLARLIKTVYDRQQQAKARGAKPSQTDERYRKRAEDLLYGELAFALDIPRTEVLDFITRTLEGTD